MNNFHSVRLKKYSYFLVLIFFILPYLYSYSKTIKVPSEQPTIQSGINAASNGDTVLVDPGTYPEHNIEFMGKAIVVTGQNPEDSLIVQSTVVDGNSAGRVFYFHSNEDTFSILAGFTISRGKIWQNGGGIFCESAPKVYNCRIIENHADNGGGGISCRGSAIFLGCRIEKNSCSGSGTGIYVCSTNQANFRNCIISDNSGGDYGTGILCEVSNNIRFHNCLIRDNSGYFYGGGVHCLSSDVSFSDCKIINNYTSHSGGGLCFEKCDYTNLSGCLISQNYAYLEGGGIYFADSIKATISNCIISENTAHSGGGGLAGWYMPYSVVKNCLIRKNNASSSWGYGGGVAIHFALSFQNCIIAENIAGDIGGGIFSGYQQSGVSLINCTITGNISHLGGGGYFDEKNVTIINSIFWGDIPEEIATSNCNVKISYSNIEGGWEGAGNINTYPMFKAPHESDYHILSKSPCIDSGTDYAAPNNDIDGDKRPWDHPDHFNKNSAFDIGADEYVPGADAGDQDYSTPKTNTNILNQNYPNPFNPVTTITYIISDKSDVILNVYSISGELVKTLVNETSEPGYHSVVWDGKNQSGTVVASGIYLYSLDLEKQKETKKMILLK